MEHNIIEDFEEDSFDLGHLANTLATT